MQVEVVPLTEFVHGSINAHEGRPMMMEESIAIELERAGLVRAQVMPRRVDRQLSVGAGAALIGHEAGKAPGDGQGQPSPSSHQAPASPTTTLHTSKPGGAKHRKTGA